MCSSLSARASLVVALMQRLRRRELRVLAELSSLVSEWSRVHSLNLTERRSLRVVARQLM
jgi:hypothetical protein